jgi:hypothetical protein
MIFGDGNFLDELSSLLCWFEGGDKWLSGVRSFSEAAKPISYLLKADWSDDTLLAISIYCRFAENLAASEVKSALKNAQPLSWDGPPVEDIGRSLNTSWPHGIGFRITIDGRLHSAVYHRVTSPHVPFQTEQLRNLIYVCGLPAHLEKTIRRDLAVVYRRGAVGVIGLDAGGNGTASALKLDVEAVPLGWALRYIHTRGAAAPRVHQIRQTAVSLSIRSIGYLGLKYNHEGFEGWKIYLPQQPRLRPPALAPRIDANKWAHEL